MTSLSRAISILRSQPAYALMRGAARFAAVRDAVTGCRSLLHRHAFNDYVADCTRRQDESMFANLDVEPFVAELNRRGVSFGLKLPQSAVSEILQYASGARCFADRRPDRGFYLQGVTSAERSLGKPILLAQYFNSSECPAIARLQADPILLKIAALYLRSIPTLVGANLWWTFPVEALESDRIEHAHMFHRDVDDFRFFKFFFYLTEVAPGEGAHVVVASSHIRPPASHFADRWNVRRYTDDEILRQYNEQDIIEICGPAGTGFAENTLSVHKGRTPVTCPRLLLQLQFALFDYGVAHDRRSEKLLANIA
jgi:hypothetical protein